MVKRFARLRRVDECLVELRDLESVIEVRVSVREARKTGSTESSKGSVSGAQEVTMK